MNEKVGFIPDFMDRYGFSITSLARAMGVTRRAVHKWTRDPTRMSVQSYKQLETLASLLDILKGYKVLFGQEGKRKWCER